MFCKNCGKEIDEKAVICVHCGTAVNNKKKQIHKKWWFWLIVVFAFIIVVGVGSSSDDTETTSNVSSVKQTATVEEEKPKIPEEFSGKCPVSVSATVKENIIGVTELQCNIENNTDKEIAAVQLYFLPKDVYGKDVDTILTNNKMYTDETINAKGSCSRNWQMLDDNIKSGDVYIYSVYFTDGTEWGDKDASTTTIKKYGKMISAES